MREIIEESFAELHKERIYRELEIEITRHAPDLKLLFNALVDWKWVDDKYCLFFYPGTIFARFCAAPEMPLAIFVRDFGLRHGVDIELRPINIQQPEDGTPFRAKVI